MAEQTIRSSRRIKTPPVRASIHRADRGWEDRLDAAGLAIVLDGGDPIRPRCRS